MGKFLKTFESFSNVADLKIIIKRKLYNIENELVDIFKYPILRLIDNLGPIKIGEESIQEPLSILYKTGKYAITYNNGIYSYPSTEKLTQIRNEDGSWNYINKLCTNSSDISDLILEFLYRICLKDNKLHNRIILMNDYEFKNYLKNINNYVGFYKDKNDISKGKTYLNFTYFERYFKENFDFKELFNYTKNAEKYTKIGDINEDIVKSCLENGGFKTLYKGGNGDPVDMIFGIDLIMCKNNNNNKIWTVQVKSKLDGDKGLLKAMENPKYKDIDMFATLDGNNIILFKRNFDKFDRYVLNKKGYTPFTKVPGFKDKPGTLIGNLIN